MNMNLIYRIERMLNSINTDTFDQELISSLIMCVREKTPKNGMAHEVGDFIAHPHLKNRGHVYNNIKKVHESLLKAYNQETNQLNGRITIDNPIHINESLIELENTFLQFDKNLKLIKNEKRVAGIQACILLLLQGSRIKVENLEGIESVELRIAVNPSKFLCLMAVLPTPIRIPCTTNKPMYSSEIKYEIITSTAMFIPQEIDAFGFGFFGGVLNAKRDSSGKIIYSLIR